MSDRTNSIYCRHNEQSRANTHRCVSLYARARARARARGAPGRARSFSRCGSGIGCPRQHGGRARMTGGRQMRGRSRAQLLCAHASGRSLLGGCFDSRCPRLCSAAPRQAQCTSGRRVGDASVPLRARRRAEKGAGSVQGPLCPGLRAPLTLWRTRRC